MAQDVDFSEFQPLSLEAWEARALKDLKGKALEAIDWEFSPGLNARAYATQEHLPPSTGIPIPSEKRGWRIAERFVVDDIEQSNGEILEALQEGCSELILAKSPNFSGDLKLVLEGVFEDMVRVVVEDPSLNQPHFAQTSTGGYAEQLADLLSQTVRHLERGESGSAKAPIRWNLELGTSFFPELAKVRAARLVLHRLLELIFGDGDLPPYEISVRNAAWPEDEDAYNNLLRGTTIAMVAAAGGADSILISPFTSDQAKQTFGRRLARNIQHILAEESFYDELRDPSDGSYYVESMTEQICEGAWEMFKKIGAS